MVKEQWHDRLGMRVTEPLFSVSSQVNFISSVVFRETKKHSAHTHIVQETCRGDI